jgi:hypothetical protein
LLIIVGLSHCIHLSIIHVPTSSALPFFSQAQAISTHSSISLFFTSVSLAGLSIHDSSSLAAVDLAHVFNALPVALPTAHSTGLAAHNAPHTNKSLPLGNSDSETISYIAISHAHSIAHAAALIHNGVDLVTNG